MSDLRRISKLKYQALDLSNRIRAENPLQAFGENDVSSTGLTRSDLVERLDRVESCSSIIELKEEWVQAEDGLEQVMKISAANFCKQHAVCPICADRSQARRRARFNDPIKDQARRVISGDRYAYIITYTVTDGADLVDRLDHLKEAKRAFRKMGQRRPTGGRSAGEAGKVRAGISTIEIKRGENSALWHVHAHELVFTDERIDYEVYDRNKRRELSAKYGKWIPKGELDKIALHKVRFRDEIVSASKLSVEWLNSTGGDSMGISVEPIKHAPDKCGARKRRKYLSMSFEESIAHQAREVLKYISKPGENSAIDAIDIIRGLYNKRMVATYGEFRNIGGDDYADDAAADQPTFVLTWNSEAGKYDDPQPGILRDAIERAVAHDTRSKCGKITGSYRRRRRDLLDGRLQYRDGLSFLLDEAKRQYRSEIKSVWSLFHQTVNSSKQLENAKCDNCSPLLAAAGKFIPGSADRRFLYASVF